MDLLVANGINVILDLHWNWGAYTNSPDWHCKDEHATCQKPMPDARYAPQFWTGVANTFKGNDAVVFDLFNEPYPDMPAEWNKTLGWQCLRDGGTCAGLPYEAAGMQDLVLVVGKVVPGVRPVAPRNRLVATCAVRPSSSCAPCQ